MRRGIPFRPFVAGMRARGALMERREVRIQAAVGVRNQFNGDRI